MACSGYRLEFRASKLDKKDGFFGKSDPFLRIRFGPLVVAESNVVLSNLNPQWNPLFLPLDAIGGSFCSSLRCTAATMLWARRVLEPLLPLCFDMSGHCCRSQQPANFRGARLGR